MLRSLWQGWILALLCLVSAGARAEFLPPEQAFNLSAKQTAPGQYQLHWKIAKGYYLYQKSIKATDASGQQSPISLPAGVVKSDEFFGASQVYHNSVDGELKVASAKGVTIAWQGCAEAGLCYQPQQMALDQLDLSKRSIMAHLFGSETSAPKLAKVGGEEKSANQDAPPRLPALASVPLLTPSADISGSVLLASVSDASDIAPAIQAQPEPTAASTQVLGNLAEDQQIAQRLNQAHIVWMLLMFFGLGLLMTFTPCVLPMLPILSSLIAGSGATPKRGFILSLAFVLSMALTYAALGAAAAMAGANLQAVLQTPWVLGLFGAIFIVLALAMFGAFELQLPAFVRDRLATVSQKSKGGTIGGAVVMGVLSALLVGPCMTAPLAGALLYISNTGDALKGSLALFSMGLGMGAPLILVGTLGARFLPRPGLWMNRVKAVFGFVLLAMAIYFIGRVLPAALVLALWGGLGLAISSYLLTLATQLQSENLPWAIRSLAVFIGLWAVLMVVGAASGRDQALQPLSVQAASSNKVAFIERFSTVTHEAALQAEMTAASQQGQWTLVDFYADWCVACKEIERDVLGDARVQQALAGMRLVRPDVTVSGQDSRDLLAKHQVLGPPTLLIIGPDGKERRAQRIVGTLSADEFLVRLAQAKQASR